MNTLNNKLLELAKEAGVNIHEYVNDPGTPATVSYEFTAGGLKRFAALLSAAQEEREPYLWVRRGARTALHNISFDKPEAGPWDALYLAPPSSDQVWNEAVEASAKLCAQRKLFELADAIRSLKRPLQAQEPECNGQCFKCECGRMPTQADPSASGAADSQPSPVTDELPSLSSLLIDVAALLASFVEDGKSLKRYEARGVLSRVRAARAALSRAQAAQQAQPTAIVKIDGASVCLEWASEQAKKTSPGTKLYAAAHPQAAQAKGGGDE